MRMWCVMSKMTTSGATGYFVEYAGSAIRNLTMEYITL